ncbi:hypothetical protein C8J57DRAFT_1536212 [Mycena rebaudengoi]|nr:hypothetical protein C8J57DRAFT_1536212 [Mycena rebaudengoi]
MFSFPALISLAIAAVTSFSGAQAQGPCLQNVGFLGAYDANTGNFVGAVAKVLGDSGIFNQPEIHPNTCPSPVATFSNACNDGGPVYTQIVSPIDQGAGYISHVAGITDCPTAAFTGSAPWAAIAAADGNPRAFSILIPFSRSLEPQRPLKTFCGENMVFALGSAVGRQVLSPAWKNPDGSMFTGLPVVQDSTFNRLLATPNPASYSAFYSGASVQQVYLSSFFQ